MTETSAPTTVASAPTQLDRARLNAIVAPIVQKHGGEVVDVEWKPESGGWVLRVFVERLGAQEKGLSTKEAAVTLELCANVARELSPALDELEANESVFPHAYNLEVSSPGVERALKSREDFARFVGEKAKIWLTKAALPRGLESGNGQRVVEGRLESFEKGGGTIVIQDGSRTFDLPFADVDRARLVFTLETGVKNKPGKPGKSSHTKNPKQSRTKSDTSPRSKTGEHQ